MIRSVLLFLGIKSHYHEKTSKNECKHTARTSLFLGEINYLGRKNSQGTSLFRTFTLEPFFALKGRASLENSRAEALFPRNPARHFVRVEQLYKEYKIVTSTQVFNIYESGFSTRSSSLAKLKGITQSGGRSNSGCLKWPSNAEHFTTMSVVSADETAWTPVVILQGKQFKWENRVIKLWKRRLITCPITQTLRTVTLL